MANLNNKRSDYGTDDDVFAIQEAYKSIRTNIILSVIKDGCKKIAITSPVSGEGKSTTSVNLAISLAQAFNRVLIVDCDLRQSRIHKALGISADPGLTNLLSGLADTRDSVQETKYTNLWALPSGISAPNPAEILASGRMSALIAELEKSFDYIIFDTPPINILSDALPIIRQCDGAILILRSGISVYSEIEKSLSRLKFIDARLLGAIVNGVERNAPNSSYGKTKY